MILIKKLSTFFLQINKGMEIIWYHRWRPIIALIILILLTILCPLRSLSPLFWDTLDRLPIFDSGKQVATPSKQITIDSLPLQELWYWSFTGRVEHLEITRENLIVLHVSGTMGDHLVALDAETGRLVWEKSFIFHINALSADAERVYVGGINKVQAYSASDGQKLWVWEQPSKHRGALYVYAQGDYLEAYNYDAQKSPSLTGVFTLDAQSGEPLVTKDYSDIFLQRENIIYTQTSGGFTARDKITDEKLWQFDAGGRLQRWPIFVDNIMYLEIRGPERKIYAVDAKCGTTYWQSNEGAFLDPDTTFVSKMTYGAKMIYVLRQGGAIVGLDHQTGQEVGRLEVSPPSVYIEDGVTRNFTYDRIAASGQFVAVYYDDSRELIVFKRQDIAQ